MKILYKNMGFGGGAPKSLLQYAQVAKKNKIEVVAVGQYTNTNGLKDYRSSNIRLLELPYFELKKPLYSFILLRKYLKIIRDEKPNIIHATTTTNCYYHKVVSKLTNIPIIYNIPGGRINRLTAMVMGNENLLVYSEENKVELIKYGYKENKITVISNRIDTNESNDKYESKYNFKEKKGSLIKILLISRFSENHIASINSTIDLIIKLKKDNYNVRLDILGDGKYFEKVSKKIEELDYNLKEKFIYMQGFVSNPSNYVLNSHIVFGKGRSVLDGVLNCRVSFVVSEENTISLCNIKNFENLKKYNFAGRKLKTIFSYEELSELIKDLYENNCSLNYLPELKKITKEFYDISYGEEKIMKLYSNVNVASVNYKPTFLATLKRYIEFYFNITRFKRNINNR